MKRYSFARISEKAQELFHFITGGDEADWRSLDEEQRSYYRLKYIHENEDEN